MTGVTIAAKTNGQKPMKCKMAGNVDDARQLRNVNDNTKRLNLQRE